MKKTTFYSILLFFTSWISFSQGGAPSCAALEANFSEYQMCATNIPFNSSVGGNGENFNSTCIPTQYVGPTWFFIEIKEPGTVVLQISQVNNNGVGSDVDFILWGPFQNLNNICSQLNTSTEADCSYLPDFVETVSIPNSNTGDLYVLLIDNYSGQPGNITVTQTGGIGSTNCDFLSSVKIAEQDNSPITQFDYCKPETKELKALIDITAFSGLPINLRFNYSWFRNNLPIQSTNNSTLTTNSISANESGIYKVIITAYDITTNPTGNLAGLRESEATIDLKFHIKPDVSISNSNTICLDTNPVLTSEISNQADMAPLVDVLNYQWYINNNPINGATNPTFTPTLPGDYYVIVTNAPCSATTSNTIRIIASPNVQIASDNVFCENDSFTITTTNSNASLNTSVTYQWHKDGIAIAGANNATLLVNKFNQTVNSTSQYYLETTEQGSCSNISNTVSITINALPIINTIPTTLEQCDYIDNTLDGIAETNLLQLYNYFTNTTSGLTLYFYSDIGLTQLITNPSNYINTTSPFFQTIYVKLVNENVTPNCTSENTGSFTLRINPTSVANYPNTAAVCPEINQNFGFINFDAQRVLIKNMFFPSSDVTISFHINTSDASTGLNALSNASQLPVGTTTIYTRVISNATQNCEGIGTFEIMVTQAPLQSLITNESVCLQDSYLLNTKDAEVLSGQSPTVVASYFNSFENARDNVFAINKNIPLLLTLGTRRIYVRLFDSLTQCSSIVDFDISIFPNPVLTQPLAIRLCGETTATFNLNSRITQITNGNANYQVTFYANNADLLIDNPITNPDNYTSTSTTIICKVVDATNNSCEAFTTLSLVVMSLPGSNSNPTPIELCNDSGFEQFDLTIRESQIAGATPLSTIEFRYYRELNDALANNNNRITNPSNYLNTTINFQKIYVRLNSRTNIDSETGLACFKILELDLYVRPFPENNLLSQPYTICIDQSNNIVYPVEIKTLLNSSDYSFTWYTGFDGISGNEIAGETNNSFITSTVGEYSVKVTNISNAALCSSIFNFTAQTSLIPEILTLNPSELIAFEVENTISATVSPPSNDYLYSIDGIYWQESNVFTNIPEGEYTLTVTNKFGCGNLSENFIILDYPRFFTPNGDGYNDTWKLKGSSIVDFISVSIFDRYGKLLKVMNPQTDEWDGLFNDTPLPSTDYWFTVKYQINNISKEFRGHFSLIR
jgi:gliding motility-associated-like protein